MLSWVLGFTYEGALAGTGISVDGALLSWLQKPLFSWKQPQAQTKNEKKEKGDPGPVYVLYVMTILSLMEHNELTS